MTATQKPNSKVDIIVPVYNAKKYVRDCLNSVLERSSDTDFQLIIVNDGSDNDTTTMLREFESKDSRCILLEHEKNLGYTRAVNTGLKHSSAPFSLLLNSDTEVTNGWLSGLISCLESDKQLGIVGPLSNAASWQSVPRLLDDDGHFYINSLPQGIKVNAMGKLVRETSLRHYPNVPFVNGFCFMARREVIDSVGYMDEKSFPLGYGEENDYCLRATKAGFKLAIADDVYVYHAKSKSFGHEKRKELSRNGSQSLKKKYGSDFFNSEAKKMRSILCLDALRAHLTNRINQTKLTTLIDRKSIKVLFVLPKPGIGGGSHSVVQEVTAMRNMGIEASIAVEQRHLKMLYDRYQEIPNVEKLFLGYVDETLLDQASNYDVVIATIFHSTNIVKYITDVFPHILPAYYIQDYEPLFFEEANDHYKDALESYNRLENGLLFAKTFWIAREVEKHHGVAVNKVVPSIDHTVYYPEPAPDKPQSSQGIVHIAAMIRPRTPRRGAERTLELMRIIKNRFGKQVSIHLFGCEESELDILKTKTAFEHLHYGVLHRTGVADLLRKSDIFVDLSDYQAFGRTSLEAMACGATAMVPVYGGGDEYAIDGQNTLVVDSFDLSDCEKRITEIVIDTKKLAHLKANALVTSQNYSPKKAANSEIDLIQSALTLHRQDFPLPEKRPCLYILSDQKIKTQHSLSDSRIANSLLQIMHVDSVSELDKAEKGILLSRGILSALNEKGLASWCDTGGIWLHEITDLRYLKKPNVKHAALQADAVVVFSADDSVMVSRFTPDNRLPIVISNEFDYLHQVRELLYEKRQAQPTAFLNSSKSLGDLTPKVEHKSFTSNRKQRLWRKFREEPRRYFADSKITGLKYLQYLFRN